MPSQIKVDQIAGATGSTVTLPSGQTLDLSSGTVNLPSTSLSTLNATNLTTGTVPNARLSGITADKLDLISTASVPSVTAKGTVGVSDGYIQLNCEYNSHGIKIKSPPHSAGASYTLVMPSATGTANQALKMNSGATALEFGTLSSKLVNYTTATNSTRFSANISSDDTYGSFNFTKQQSGTTLYITGAVPMYGNDNGGSYEYGKIGSTYKYIGIHYVKGVTVSIEYGGLSFNQVWTGIGSGLQTFSFGQKSSNNSSNRPNLIINPNTSEDARNQQGGWSFIVWELET